MSVAVLGCQAAVLSGTDDSGSPPPSGSGPQHLVGASVNYNGHPTIPDGGLQADFLYFDEQLRVELGLPAGTKVLAGPHGFHTGWHNTFQASAVAWAPGAGYGFSVQNMKIGGPGQYQAAAGGAWDAAFTTYVQSVPDGHLHVVVVEHEPEDNGAEPDEDGGTYQATYGDWWARMQARFAEICVTLNRPNVWLAVVHMGFTWPTNGQPGSLNSRGRDPRAWNPWKYMSAAAKARTILAPDVYTDMTGATSYTSLRTKHGRIMSYVQADGWGVVRHGITEHTVNNDVLSSDSAVAAAWRDDVRVHLRDNANRMAYYMAFNTSSGRASGVNGWVDLPQELTEFGAMARELNAGGGGSTGTTGVVFVGAATGTANNATPSLALPAGAAAGHYAVVQFTCRDTVTLTDPAGWTVHVSADAGGGRYRVYGKFLAGTETTTNVVPSMGGTTSRWAAEMLVYSGVHATPVNGTPGVVTSAATGTAYATGTTTTTVAGCTILSLASNRSGTNVVTSYTAPGGYTVRAATVQTTNAGATAAAADKANAVAGTYGPDTWTTDIATGSWAGVTLALRPA